MLCQVTDPEPPPAAGGGWIPSPRDEMVFLLGKPQQQELPGWEKLNFDFKNVTHTRRGKGRRWRGQKSGKFTETGAQLGPSTVPARHREFKSPNSQFFLAHGLTSAPNQISLSTLLLLLPGEMRSHLTQLCLRAP